MPTYAVEIYNSHLLPSPFQVTLVDPSGNSNYLYLGNNVSGLFTMTDGNFLNV